MVVSGILGAASQMIATITSASERGKTEASNNVSFLSTAKEVAENMAGMIVVAGRSDIKQPDFLKEKFGYESKDTDEIDTINDFIEQIGQILKDKDDR
jgi:hypothetical protein